MFDQLRNWFRYIVHEEAVHATRRADFQAYIHHEVDAWAPHAASRALKDLVATLGGAELQAMIREGIIDIVPQIVESRIESVSAAFISMELQHLAERFVEESLDGKQMIATITVARPDVTADPKRAKELMEAGEHVEKRRARKQTKESEDTRKQEEKKDDEHSV